MMYIVSCPNSISLLHLFLFDLCWFQLIWNSRKTTLTLTILIRRFLIFLNRNWIWIPISIERKNQINEIGMGIIKENQVIFLLAFQQRNNWLTGWQRIQRVHGNFFGFRKGLINLTDFNLSTMIWNEKREQHK